MPNKVKVSNHKRKTCSTTKSAKRPPKAILTLPLERWPAQDQKRWAEALVPATRWMPSKHAQTLTPTTIKNTLKSCGRLFAILQSEERLNPNEELSFHVTPENMDIFINAMRTEGNKDSTIKNRLFLIRTAMHMMAATVNFDWLTRPGGVSINNIFEDDILPLETIDPALVTDAAHQMISAAHKTTKPAERLRLLRNGLLFGLLAGRAPRLGSIAKMQIGRHLTGRGDGFWITFTKQDMKNKHALSYSLPAHLNNAMKWYLYEVRSSIVGRDDHEYLWVCDDGAPFQYSGIGKMCFVESEKWLYQKMGPHRHRHNLATMMANEAPENPGAAAAVLGISELVVTRNYDQVKEQKAHEINQHAIKIAREKSRLMAERLFGVPLR